MEYQKILEQIKTHPKLNKLFKSNSPSEEYIKEALEFLNNIQEVIE
jgi:hypothetical protein